MDFDIEATRQKFEEEHIYYRKFMYRHADGTYKYEWVEELWRGWKMALGSLRELLEDGNRWQYVEKHLGRRHVNELLELAGEMEDDEEC